MNTSSSHRRRVATALPMLLSFAAVCLTALPAAALKLGPHQQILQNTVYPRVGAAPFDQILGTLLSGQGNLGSDRHQFDDFRHFDSAPSRQAVCDRANAAWNKFYGEIRGIVQPQNGPEYDQVGGVAEARSAFGALTHAIQDFYAHSNWVELHVAAGQPPPIATALFPNCVPTALPAGLETGYFDLAYGLGGCPNSPLNDAWIPPAGFSFCHETLNKDSDQTRHGRELIPGTSQTYHAAAVQLATDHTTALYNLVISQLAVDWPIRFPQVRTDCLITRVIVSDATVPPCRFARLSFVNDSHNGGTRLADGTVVVRDSAGAVVVSKSVSKGSWPFPVVNVPRCLGGLRVEWQFYVDDAYITPAPRTVSGNSQISGIGCDADIHINPENLLTYLVRFTNSDTKIAAFTSITVTVNNGQRQVPVPGPIPAGTTIWMDLGQCNTVLNLDFIFRYIDPIDLSTPRTATPSPPPHQANAGCLDTYNFDLGGEIYGP
jgi:hypothetical protein